MTDSSVPTVTTSISDLSFESIFGSAIPLLIGKCVVAGKVFWSSADNTTLTKVDFNGATTVTATPVNFAVAFGHVDPLAEQTYISRLWINGSLVYDATGKTPIVAPGLSITLYAGSETQSADPTIRAAVGKYCPAFKGLCYVVIQGINFAYLSGYPTVVAEITQVSNVTYTVYEPEGTPGERYTANQLDEDANTLNLVGQNVIDVFDLDTETLLYSLPIALPGAPGARPANANVLTLGSCFLTGGRLLTMGSNLGAAGTNTDALDTGNYAFKFIVIDMASGLVLAASGPFSDHAGGLLDGPIELAVGKTGSSVLGSDWGSGAGGLYLYGLSNNALTRKRLAFNNDNFSNSAANGYYSCLQPAIVGDFPPCMTTCQYVAREMAPYVVDLQNDGSNTGENGVDPIDGATYATDPVTKDVSVVYNRAMYADLIVLPRGGVAGTYNGYFVDSFGSGPVKGSPTNKDYKTVSAPDPTFFFGTLDDFDLFYAIKDGKSIVRIISTGGKQALVGQIASVIGNSLNIRQNTAVDPGYILNSEFLDLGAYITVGFTFYPDPEVMSGTITGFTYLVGTEPTIKRVQGDSIDTLYTLTNPDESIRWLMVGPSNDPYVAVLVHNAKTGVDVIRKFETFYSQKATETTGPIFDANYYLIEGGYDFTPATFVNPPMRDAVFNKMAAYDDLVIPTLPGDLNIQADNALPECRKPAGAGAGFFSYSTGTQLVLIDVGSLIVTTKNVADFVAPAGQSSVVPVPTQITYDSVTGLLYDPISSINFFLNAGVPVGDTTLARVLTSLCLLCGYTADQIDVSNMATVDVQGCVINQSVALTQILAAIGSVFSLDIFDTDNKINFVRKLRGAAFAFDLEVADTDLLPATDSGANDTTSIKYDRAYSGDLPVTQTLEYIDGPNFGAVGTQTAKRTSFPIRTTASDQTVDATVPIIMDAAAAIYWANAMLFDAWASALTLTLRLGPEGFALDPGDYLAVNRANGAQEPIRVTSTTLNADKTVSVEGTSLVQFNDFDSPAIQAPTLSVKALVKTTPPIPAIFENILFQIEDDSGSTIPLRYTSDQTMSLSLYQNGAYAPVGAARTSSPIGTLMAAMPKTYAKGGTLCLWETDKASTVLVRFKVKPVLSGSMMIVGQPGRWELVIYASAVPRDATGLLWAVSGLQRGRRGTDPYVNTGRAGDYAIFPASIAALSLFAVPFADAGAGLAIKAAPTGGVGANSTATITPGATHAPWAPCGLACDRSASATQAGRYDLVFTWLRRTRDEADTIHDGDANVRNEFGTEAYNLTLSVGPRKVHTENSLGTSSFTYTAEQQIADNLANDPTSIVLSVCQVGNGLNGLFALQQFTF